MIVGYDSPIVNSSTAAAYSGTVNTSLAGLVDGRPGALCELAWSSDSPQTTSTTEDITITFENRGITPKVAMLVNTSLPVGTKVELILREVGGSFNYQTTQTRLQTMPNGEVSGVWVLPDGLNTVDGVRFRIYNDVDGSADLTQGESFTVGECWITPAKEVCLAPDFSLGFMGSGQGLSLNNSLYVFPAAPRRSGRLKIAATSYADSFTGTNTLQDLALSLMENPRSVIVLDERTTASIYNTALFASIEQVEDLTGDRAGPYFTMGLTVKEAVGRAPN